MNIDTVIHARADVHPTVHFGICCVVWSSAVIEAGVKFGDHCAVGSCVFIGADSHLGDSVRIQHGVFLPRRSRVGDRVFIGPNSTFTDDRYPRVNNPKYRAEPPVIENDVSIGAGAIILAGVKIGRGAMVGAGCVVLHDVPEYTTIVGNPGRFLAHPLAAETHLT